LSECFIFADKKLDKKNREIIVAFCLEIWDNFFNAYKIQGSA